MNIIMNTNIRIYDLPCLDSHKSFYGKAKVIKLEDGSKFLESYNTVICSIDANGKFHRYWEGESATTMRHINSFLTFFNLSGGGLSWWREQPIEKGK